MLKMTRIMKSNGVTRSRNCFCGSGRRYSKCCYVNMITKGSSLKEYEYSNKLRDLNKRIKINNTCAWPGCNGKACQSHTISKNLYLGEVASNKHVGILKLSPPYDFSNGTQVLEDTKGVNIFSACELFCSHHDNIIFNPIDNGDLSTDGSARDVVTLQSYRTIWWKIRNTEREIKKNEDGEFLENELLRFHSLMLKNGREFGNLRREAKESELVVLQYYATKVTQLRSELKVLKMIVSSLEKCITIKDGKVLVNNAINPMICSSFLPVDGVKFLFADVHFLCQKQLGGIGMPVVMSTIINSALNSNPNSHEKLVFSSEDTASKETAAYFISFFDPNAFLKNKNKMVTQKHVHQIREFNQKLANTKADQESMLTGTFFTLCKNICFSTAWFSTLRKEAKEAIKRCYSYTTTGHDAYDFIIRQFTNETNADLIQGCANLRFDWNRSGYDVRTISDKKLFV